MALKGSWPLKLKIELPNGQEVLNAGSSLAFGRAPGSGCISESDMTVSSHHGTISHDGDSWSVTSTGSYLGFSVHDVVTASGFEIPVGLGPVTVPFGQAIITVTGREARLALAVTGPVSADASAPATPSGSTVPIVDRTNCIGRDGKALRWFQVLILLCEPMLTSAGAALGSVPADKEIRRRLGIGSSTMERALTRAREELGFAPHTPQLRVVMAITAINQGVVTPADLALLP